MRPTVARFYWSHLSEAKRVLDLGCADGHLSRYKSEGVEVHGLDLNTVALEEAQQYEKVRVWDLDSIEPLPFPDAYFDAVVAKDILEHLQKPWRTVVEIKRVTRPGGIILASVICERGHRTWGDYTHVRGFTMQSVRQMFIDAGLEVLGVWRMGGVPLTSRLNLIWLVPYLLRLPPLDWIWTSSYEIKARKK
jgi:2-polyprenyl-3-methyl-5-hydroxy-6-metoxy-1,4-benzoquinol methylase